MVNIRKYIFSKKIGCLLIGLLIFISYIIYCLLDLYWTGKIITTDLSAKKAVFEEYGYPFSSCMLVPIQGKNNSLCVCTLWIGHLDYYWERRWTEKKDIHHSWGIKTYSSINIMKDSETTERIVVRIIMMEMKYSALFRSAFYRKLPENRKNNILNEMCFMFDIIETEL